MPKHRYKRLRSDSDEEFPSGHSTDTREPVSPLKHIKFDDMTKSTDIDYLNGLSLELLCRILTYLPLKEVMKIEHQSQKLQEAVTLHLRLLTKINFTEGQIYAWMPTGFSDESFARFMKRFPEALYVHGLHLRNLSKRRQRGSEVLSVPGIIAALSSCEKLAGVETSDIFVLEALLTYLPHVEILGIFKNRGGTFPMLQQNKFDLTRSPRITSLYLTGVVINDLPRMEHLKHLYLKWTKLTDPTPFKDFGVPLLRSFVMSNCAGPTNALKYVPMVTALAAARSLTRLELIRVPFLGGLFQHVVEDSWRVQGFRQLHKIVFGACKHALEVDLGYLMITAANRLGELAIQPSLTKDSVFSSLAIAQIDFTVFETLHLGFVDDFPEAEGKWTNEELVKQGLADVVESPAMITDIGMKEAAQVLTNLRNLTIYNCPHLHLPTVWFTGVGMWNHLKELHVRRCHAIRLKDFCAAVPMMSSLESLILEQMFREPPKGCSRVGLSAGTGLGVSSALVQNTGNDAPNQDAANNNPPVNQAPNNQAPAANPPENNANQEENAGAENEIIVQNGHNGPVHGPVNEAHVPNHNVREEMEVDAIENDALNDDHDKPCAIQKNVKCTPLEQNNKNVGNSSEEEGDNVQKSCCSCDCHKNSKSSGRSGAGSSSKASGHRNNDAHPGTSNGMQLRPRSSTGIVTPKKEDSRRKDKDCWDFENDKNTSRSCQHYRRRKSNQSDQKLQDCNEAKDSKVEQSKERSGERSETPDGRSSAEKEAYASSLGLETKLRRSARLSRGHGCNEESTPSKTQSSPSPGNGNVSSSDPETTSPEPGQRKGKSWFGRKKGIMKKHGAHNKMNQSCQAVSEEIRETTKKAKEAEEATKTSDSEVKASEGKKGAKAQKQRRPATNSSTTFTPIKPDSSPDSGWTPCGWGAHMGTRSRVAGKRKPNTRNQATSTSDPVIEDDHEQELVIKSDTLINLTLKQVGVTDLVIQRCPKLQMLSGNACRVLKNVSVKQSPRILRVNFVQCAKLKHEKMINEVCTNPSEKSRLIVIRPLQNYNVASMEKLLFGSPKFDYHICLVQDHSNEPEDTVQNRTRMASWLSTLASINSDLSKMLEFPKLNRLPGQHKRYPWGRDMYRMQGVNDLGHRWDMVSDLPWLRTLTTANRHPMSYACNFIHQAEDDRNGSLSGLCQEVLQEIAEYKEERRVLYPNSVFVYVNLCDVDGIPTDDKYI